MLADTEVVVRNQEKLPYGKTVETAQNGNTTKTNKQRKPKKVSMRTDSIDGYLISSPSPFPIPRYETFCEIVENDIYEHFIQEVEKHAASKNILFLYFISA